MNILLIEVFVVITIGWAATLYWVTRRWLRQKLAWQWWQAQQTQRLHHQAESIRDRLLQQTFAFRRYLESQPTANAPHPAQTERWVNRFQSFYQSLESLSNELSPPFVADSLPLALQFIVKDWQKTRLQLTLTFDMPPDWESRSPQQNQPILSIVTALLSILVPTENIPQQLHLTLSQNDNRNTLELTLQGNAVPTSQSLLSTPEIQHLKEIFHSLVAGQLEISQDGAAVISQLSWSH